MKKRLLNIAAGLVVLAMLFTGCSSDKPAETSNNEETQANSGSESGYPTKAINLIIPFAAGGATDIGARALAPYLQEEIGTTVNVINTEGGGGWVAWNDLLKATPDGYQIGYFNTPHAFSYLNPELNRGNVTFESFELLANHVTDYGIIAIQKNDSRFTDLKSLIEYAKNNELTAAATTAGSDDHISLLKLNKQAGIELTPVHFGGGINEAKTAFLGGHVDVYFGNIGDSFTNHNNGDYKIIAVLAEERSDFIPDVQTAKEQGYEIFSWSSRGIVAPKGLPEDVKAKIIESLETAMADPEYLQKSTDLGLTVDFRAGEDYKEFLAAEEEGIKSVLDLLGWKK